MKRVLLITLFVALADMVGAQSLANFKASLFEPDTTNFARVLVVEAEGSAATAIAKFDSQTTPQQSFNGYRIRIYSGNSQSARTEAEAAQKLFTENYNVPTYFAYENPYFLVSCGNCLTQEEAIMLLSKVKIHFPKAFIVMAEIPATVITTTYDSSKPEAPEGEIVEPKLNGVITTKEIASKGVANPIY